MKYISQILASFTLGLLLLLAPACCNRVGCDSACAPRCAPVCGDCTTDCPPVAAAPEYPAPAEQVAQAKVVEAPVEPAQLPTEDQALASEGDYEMSYDAEEAAAAAPAVEAAQPIKAEPKPVRKVNDDLSK